RRAVTARRIGGVGAGGGVLGDVVARAEQPLLLAAPQGGADRPARLDAEGLEDAHRLHHHYAPGAVVGRAGGGVPRIEVGTGHHDLPFLVGPGDLGDDVVGRGIVVEEAGLEVDLQLHRLPLVDQPDHVVVRLGGHDQGGYAFALAGVP